MLLLRNIQIPYNYRTLMCEQCGKQFKQRGSLLQHLHSHTGLKLFNCQLCHKDFSRSAHLMMHMRIHDKIKV